MCGPSRSDSDGIVQKLQGLMDRLAAPDLTAAEAEDLRPRLLVLLESIELGEARRTFAPGLRPVARKPERCLVV